MHCARPGMYCVIVCACVMKCLHKANNKMLLVRSLWLWPCSYVHCFCPCLNLIFLSSPLSLSSLSLLPSSPFPLTPTLPANINDRSMLGDRDSEVALRFEDKEMVQSTQLKSVVHCYTSFFTPPSLPLSSSRSSRALWTGVDWWHSEWRAIQSGKVLSFSSMSSVQVCVYCGTDVCM